MRGVPNTLFYETKSLPVKHMASPLIPDPLARLKVLLDSSTPIVAIESVEEVRAVRLVHAACAALNLATFEWTIASGLVRCGSDVGEVVPEGRAISTSAYGAAAQEALVNSKAIYNSQEPAQMLGNLEGISVGPAFILKDLHRHMGCALKLRRMCTKLRSVCSGALKCWSLWKRAMPWPVWAEWTISSAGWLRGAAPGKTRRASSAWKRHMA